MKPTRDRSATEGQHGFVGGIPPGGARVYYVFQRDMGPRMRDEWMGWLSAEERVRQARYQRESDRDLYLMAHGMLRRVLAQHTGLSPDALRFETNRFGRPELSDDAAGRSIRFNLTHTPGLAACAVAADRAVGVDAENLDREIDLRSVSARVFSPAEIRGLDELIGRDATERFYLHWTLKEAYVKALGMGFSLPLRRITTLPMGNDRAGLRLDEMADDASRWLLCTHRAGAAHQISLALEAPASAPVRFEELPLA